MSHVHISCSVLGNEDALALMLDAIMDGCNDACFKDGYQHESYQHGGHCRLNQLRTTKRISDAIFNLRSPTQANEHTRFVCLFYVFHSRSSLLAFHSCAFWKQCELDTSEGVVE